MPDPTPEQVEALVRLFDDESEALFHNEADVLARAVFAAGYRYVADGEVVVRKGQVVLDSRDRETLEALVRGIDSGKWDPTVATKRWLAGVVRTHLLAGGSDGR